MAGFLRDTPIKRKLMLVILLTTGFALLLTATALTTTKRSLFAIRSRSTWACWPELSVQQSQRSRLSRSKNCPADSRCPCRRATRYQAAIYDREGNIFARFPTSLPISHFPKIIGAEGYRFQPVHLTLFQSIRQDQTRLGTIYLQADLNEMYSRVAAYGLLLLFVGGCSSLGAITLTATLQRRISVPILELAKVASSVSQRPDYSVRAIRHGADEIGQLTDAFNHMLVRIGESNAALAAGEERLRLALEGSRTGTWDWNFSTGRIRWDDYMYPLYGRTEKDFDGTIESFLQIIHPDDRAPLERDAKGDHGRCQSISISEFSISMAPSVTWPQEDAFFTTRRVIPCNERRQH